MKKVLLLALLVVVAVIPAMAGDGSFKAGGMVGYPTALTAGYRFSDFMEVNVLAGLGFGYPGYYSSVGGIVGANLMFTLYTFDISGQKFPLSFGPAGNVVFGQSYFGVDGLANLRLEYTFEDIPLNLFAEVGAGIHYYDYKWDIFGIDYDDSGIRFQASGSVGARYVF